MSDSTPIPAAQVARTYVAPGTVWDVARNRDHTTGAGALIPQDLGATTDRPGVWLQWVMLAGFPVAHGDVADEAAMLALHTFAMDSADNPSPRYVAPGDSCLRTDDPGWRWYCLSGHGTTLADWERRPLAGALTAIEAGVAGAQPLDADLTAIAAQGVSAWGLARMADSGATAAKNALGIIRADIGDTSAAGRALMAVGTPSTARLPQINPDGSVTLIDVPSGGGGGGGGGGTVLDTTGLEHWWQLPWYKSQSPTGVTLGETGAVAMHSGQVLGKFSSAFSGSGQYFTLASAASLQVGAGSFSVACWVRPTSTSAAGLMSKWDYNDNQREWLLNISSGKAQFNLRNAANTGVGGQVIQPGTLVAGEWVHLVGVYDAAAATIALHVNAVRTAGAVTGGTRSGTARFVLGASGVSSAAVENLLSGRIAEVSIWHRALSDAEVGVLYNSGAGVTLPFVAP